ncbi:MAG: hypothetical protein AAGG44_20445 [Planctomycetota bacterium]
MNSETKRPLISLPFIIVMGTIAVVGIFFGRPIMEQIMLMQESAKADYVEAPEEFAGLSELAKNLQKDPDTQWDGSVGMGGSGGGGGGFDPEKIFTDSDADGDGKLTGDEISGRMANQLDKIDADGDGSITKEEFMEAIANMGQGNGSDSKGSSDKSDDDA